MISIKTIHENKQDLKNKDDRPERRKRLVGESRKKIKNCKYVPIYTSAAFIYFDPIRIIKPIGISYICPVSEIQKRVKYKNYW